MAVVLGGALAVGARGDGGPATIEERLRSITSEIRCPTCRSQSVADSDAPAARFMRDEVRQRLQAGESDGEITAYLVSRYGDDIRLEPERTGVAGLVWVLPVAGVLIAVTGLGLVFRRGRRRPAETVSAADRARVEQALRDSEP
ncbi:MAG: cytochrome c-type biogenesis protein CcmH [Actinomycetota bacterium]|nr:cytochrome c-type biogenesis protein CcmH [Actinomycetota bacterium]